MEISPELFAAQAAVATAEAHRDALVKAAAELRAKVARAAVRLPELAAELDRLLGRILEDDAVAGVAGAARLSARERAAAERTIAGLRAERAELAQGAEGADAGGLALQERIAAATAALHAAAGAFVREKRRFDAALGVEFQGDFARLTMPALFGKWSAIPHGGIGARLAGLSIATFSAEGWDGLTEANSPILHHGRYLDPEGGWVDWKAAWRADQALVVLREQYVALTTLETRCGAILARAEQQRRNEAEASRLAEQQRRQREYRPASVSSYVHHTPQSALEREPRWPPPQIIGPNLGEASEPRWTSRSAFARRRSSSASTAAQYIATSALAGWRTAASARRPSTATLVPNQRKSIFRPADAQKAGTVLR